MLNEQATEIDYVDVGQFCKQSTYQHPEYIENMYMWMLMKDFTKGELAVKRQNELYLPIPTGFLSEDSIPLSSSDQAYMSPFQNKNAINQRIYDPNYHTNASYAQYKSGAKVPSMLSYTVSGLSGLIVKKPMKFTSKTDMEKDLGEDYDSNSQKQRKIRALINKVITYGRCALVLNSDDNFVLYDAMSIEDWEENVFVKFTESAIIDNKEVYTKVRISQVGNSTVYERFTEEGILIERDSTTAYGRLPVEIIGSTDLEWDVDIIPLEGIGLCAGAIYKKTAELSYAEFSSCVPTLVITGVDDDAKPKAVGGGVALVISNELAKAYYTTTDTNALQHVKIHIDALYDEAKTYGASLLAGDKNEVESAEAIRLRQSASGATLSSMTKTIEAGVNDIISLVDEDIRFSINFTLEENYLTEKEQSSLLNAWMTKGISYNAYFNNMQKAGLIVDERTVEQELEMIKKDTEERKDLVEEPEMVSDTENKPENNAQKSQETQDARSN